jgi:hypothetical protein
MATTILEHPVREIHGALERKGIINRMKKYRSEDGRIIHEGVQESYAVRNPRDYKKNPPQGAELAHLNMFRQACWLTKEILDADKPEETPTVSILPQRPNFLTKEEAQALLADYRKRYQAQLPSTRGTRPDPQAPIDKNTHAPKRFFRLDNFIRSMVYQSLKNQQSAQQSAD